MHCEVLKYILLATHDDRVDDESRKPKHEKDEDNNIMESVYKNGPYGH